MNNTPKYSYNTSNDDNNREIQKAIYLMGTKSALYNGHAGLLLIDKDSRGIFYSTVFSVEKTPDVLKGKSAPFRLYKKQLSAFEVQKYFSTGKIPNIDDDLITNFYLSNYNKYIIIPIESKEQGKLLFDRAEQIRTNPNLFNLYEYNCGHITQDILNAGNTNFAPIKGDKEFVLNQFEDINKSIKQWNLFMALKKSIKTYNTAYELGIIPKGSFYRGSMWANERGYAVGTITSDSMLQLKRKNWFMKTATFEAMASVNNYKGRPLGAVLVYKDKIIGRSYNNNDPYKDLTISPEIVAIRNGLTKLKNDNEKIDLSRLELFTTAEPTPIAVAAICLAGIKKVYMGAIKEDLVKYNIYNNDLFDTFSKTPKQNDISISICENINDVFKNDYNYDKENGSSNDTAWIFKTRRDKRGNLYKSLVATGQDNINSSNDVTAYGIVNAIRKAHKSTSDLDLSKFELVSAYRPGPVSYAAIYSANIKTVITEKKLEEKNKDLFPKVLDTLQCKYGMTMFKMQFIGRNPCLKVFDYWKDKNSSILLSKSNERVELNKF